jgi:hypothetical protein
MEYFIGHHSLHVPFMLETLRFLHNSVVDSRSGFTIHPRSALSAPASAAVPGLDRSIGYRIFTPVTKLFGGDPYNR